MALSIPADLLMLDQIPDEDWPDIKNGHAYPDGEEHAGILFGYLRPLEHVGWQRRLRTAERPEWTDWKECTAVQADYTVAHGWVERFPEVQAEARKVYA